MLMHSVLKQCEQELGQLIKEYDLELNDTNPMLIEMAKQHLAYPITYTNEEGNSEPGLVVFILFNLYKRISAPIHTFNSLDEIEDELAKEPLHSKLISQVITGENKINLEADINSLSDFKSMVLFLYEDGIVDEEYFKQIAFFDKLEAIDSNSNLIVKGIQFMDLGVSFSDTIKILANNESDK